jgi:hypothetical protein
VNKLWSFSRGNPTGFQPLFLDAAKLEHFFKNGHTLLGGIITIQVIAFTEVSAAHKDAVYPLLKSKKNMMR